MNNQPPRGLSFDPNTKATGVAYTEGETVIYTHLIEAADVQDMINQIRNYIFNNNHLEYVGVENYYLGKNFHSAALIAALVISIQAAARFVDVPCFTGSAMEINKALGIGPGRKRKPANKEIARCMGFEDISQDEADAVAVALWAWGQYKESEYYEQK